MSQRFIGTIAVIAAVVSLFVDGNIGFAILVGPLGLDMIFGFTEK